MSATEPEILEPEQALPFLTAQLPGIGGQIKQLPEDFVVDELPAYPCCGVGEHLFLWIEKIDVAGEDLLRHVARSLRISSREIGMAGIKDRRAVTRQYLSVPAGCEPSVGNIETARIRVLARERHRNKLRTGHLRGNRFSILVRGAVPDAANRAGAIAERLCAGGCPNYYGDQRFGGDRENLRTGFELLRGTLRPGAIPASRRRFLLRMTLSAVQSALFNRVLAERLTDGLFNTVLAGDVMQVAATGGPFVVDEPETEQERFDRRETLVTGPMFGPEMTAPLQVPAAREQRVLDASQLAREDFLRFPKLTSGTRRALGRWPVGLRLAQEPDGLRLEFELPSGMYATSVLREFTKSDTT